MEKNIPWINNIYMVVASPSQVPDWLDTDKVKIIYHKDIIPEKFLPVFNTFAIKLFLHNIPGLSEKFIESDDDFYVNIPVTPEMYFKNGLPCLCLDEKVVKKWSIHGETAYRVIKKTWNLVKKKLFPNNNDDTIYTCTHHDKPMLKSVNEHVFKIFEQDIYDSITKFRNEINIVEYIFMYWNVLTKNYIHYRPNNKMYILKNDNLDRLKRLINNNECLVSIDFSSYTSIETINRLRDFLESKYHNKSKFEKY
jgi:hypothetical protein